MAMQVSDSFRLIPVLASLLMAHSVLMKEYEISRGVPVLLPHRCTHRENMNRGDGREVLVRYQPDRSSFVNNALMPVKNDLRREIVTIMSMRQEQVLFFKADENLSYGDVAEVLSDLKQDDPKLFIALVTKDQIGSVDGTQWGQANLCLP